MSQPGQKAIQSALKRARETGQLNLQNQSLEQFPLDICRFAELTFEGQQWWALLPLSKIDLSNNEIKQIPGDLANQIEITLIRMINNKVQSLPAQLFTLKQLKSIDFTHNQLFQIPPQISQCQSLVEVNLQDNQLSEIPQPFNQLNNLELLNLSMNKISIFPNLKGMKTLKRIDLSQNQIQIVPKQALLGCEQLEQLILSKNVISYVEPGAFFSIKRIIHLFLDQNKLEVMNEVPVSEAMDSINLSYNKIQVYTEFANTPNLTALVINNNKLKHLDKSILIMKKLKTLDLSNNDLSDIPSEIGLLTQLVRINIEGNPLKSIRSSIKQAGAEVLKKYLKQRIEGDTSALERELQTGKNQINSMEQEVDFWEQMFRDFYCNQEFVCRQMHIKEISQKLYDKIDLKTLDISKNEIRAVGAQIANFTQLRVLNLSENQIEMLPPHILGMQELVQIELKQNRIEDFFSQINLSMVNLPNLQVLDLSINRLYVLPQLLLKLPCLRVLNFAYNQINNIDILFNEASFLNKLEVIDASNNKIAEISDQVAYSLPNLQHLNLENNNIIRVPTIIGFMNLASFKIDGNPQKMIKRAQLDKGSATILDYLKSKHTDSNPQNLAWQRQNQQKLILQENLGQQQQQQQKQQYQDRNMRQENPRNQQQQQWQQQQQQQQRNPQYEENKQQYGMQQQQQQYGFQQQQQYGYQQQQNILPGNDQRSQIRGRNIDEIQRDIDNTSKQIQLIENEMQQNYSLNKFQKADLKKQAQSLMVTRSQFMTEMKQQLDKQQ